MKLLTSREKAKRAAKEWKRLYHYTWRPSRWSRAKTPAGEKPKVTYEKLLALGDDPDPDAVNAITGSKDYTLLTCELCGNDVTEVVACDELELEPQFCCRCLLKAMMLIEP